MSDTSAPIARERLQLLFAREQKPACDSELSSVPHEEILSATSEQISVDPDNVKAKTQRHDHVTAPEIDLATETPSPMPALENEAAHSSLQQSPGGEATKPVGPTNAMPTNNVAARNSRFSWLWAAAAIVVTAGVAWRVGDVPRSSNASALSPHEEARPSTSRESETNIVRLEAPALAQALKISPAPEEETAQTGASETSIKPAEGVPLAPAKKMSSTPPTESMAQGHKEAESIITPMQTAGNAGDDLTQIQLPNGIEVDAPSFSAETKLLGFLKQTSKKSGEFDLDRISFNAATTTLSPSSSEQLQNVAKILKAYPNTRIAINAYVVKAGNRASGLRLARERANSVLRELARTGHRSRLTAQFYRDNRVTRSNGSAEGQWRDQRISLTVTRR